MKVLSLVGARPNFMKIAPLAKEFKRKNIAHILMHTGQHYDKSMSGQFFEELEIPAPDINLGVGSGSHAKQIAKILEKTEDVLLKEKPDVLVVVGDVNSTLAGALAASKSGIKVAHVEAGLRSHDRTMPEEINRIVIDHVSDMLFTPVKGAAKILRKEGIPKEKIYFVGNVMIDCLISNMDKIDKSSALSSFDLQAREFGVVTLHRPSNVDNKDQLARVLGILAKLQKETKLLLSLHPRTEAKINEFGLRDALDSMKNLIITKPLGYVSFLNLVKNSKFVLTDSGGIQEETTFLGVPCITMRENTERHETIEQGTNVLVGNDEHKIMSAVLSSETRRLKEFRIPQKWDGKASQRIVRVLANEFTK